MSKHASKTGSRISLGNAATVLIVVALMGQALGFLRNRLISTNFTVHDPGSSDAFFVAFQIPDFFYYAIAGGAIGVALIPFLSDKLERGDRKGLWEITNSLLNLLTVFMFFISLAMMIFAPQLVRLLAPNLPADHLSEAITIMRFISFSPLFFTLSGILTGVQQAYGRFFFYAVAPLIYNASIILSVFLFRNNLGVVGLGIGALVGAVLQLLVVRFGLIGLGFKYSPKILWKRPDFKGVLRQLPPRSLDQGIDQVNSIVEVNRAQALGVGPVSWYNFALTLHYVPIILIGNSISTAAFPRLTERLSQGRPDLFRRDFRMVLRVLVWITMPIVVVGYFARGYLARLIFGDVAPEVALIFGFLTIAILFRIIYSMFSRFFYAHKDTITPLLVSVFAIGLNIYLAFKLARPGSYGITGLALAQSIVAASEVAILFVFMIRRDPKIFADGKFWGALVRTFSVTGFSVMAAFIMVSLLPLKITDRGFVTLGVKFGAIASVTLLVHVVMSLLFGLKEPRPVLQKLKQIIIKPIKI